MTVTVSRLETIVGRLRRIAREAPRFAPEVDEIVAELARLFDLAPTKSSTDPGPRAMGAKRRCPSHREGRGADVSASRFRPGRDVCRQCEARAVRVDVDRVTVQVLEGDRCIGRDCPVCGMPFEIGERVTGEHLHHEGCRS